MRRKKVSYDVAIFFNMESENIEDVAKTLEKTFGFSLLENRVLALDFQLQKRKSFLEDDGEMNFSDYSYQIEITSRVGGADLIHPIGFMIADTISANYSCSVMFCLSSVEVLAAKFKGGNVIVNKMAEAEKVVGGGHWKYLPLTR